MINGQIWQRVSDTLCSAERLVHARLLHHANSNSSMLGPLQAANAVCKAGTDCRAS